MKAELHKVTFQIHGVLRDDEGNIVDEIHAGGGQIQQPDGSVQTIEFKVWAHKLDTIQGEVAAILSRLEVQFAPQEGTSLPSPVESDAVNGAVPSS